MRGEVPTIRPSISKARGDAEWFAQSAEYYADNPDAHRDRTQSGTIGSGQETWMQTTVVGPGNISFYYKMSSVSGDALAFYIDQGVAGSWSQGSTWPWTGNIPVPAGPHTLRWKYYKYSGSTEGNCWIDAIQWTPQVSTASYLQDPLDTDLVVYTGGDSSWSETTSVYYYDNDSAYSGWPGDNKQSMMLVNVEGPGRVTFWWKVSSEANYDWLSFYADGALQDRISGEVGWQQKSYPLGGDGTHALVWVYSKDSNDTDGSDRGWVDYLQWTPSAGGGSSTTDWEQITYTYDPSGRRIAKNVDGVVTKYLYDGDQCIAEYDANDVLLRKYIHGPSIDEPICMIEAAGGYAGTYYYHFDALGSVVALSDADGDIVQVYEYDVYGQVAASNPNHPNRFLFTGREFDKETGLYYYRARYYNASIGRFLQTDPIGYEDGLNMYRYCGNNPMNAVDPSGLMPSIYAHPEAPVELTWVLGFDEVVKIYGEGLLSAWIVKFPNYSGMITQEMLEYVGGSVNPSWLINAVLKAGKDLIAASPGLWEIMEDDKKTKTFFNHHFGKDSYQWSGGDALLIFLRSWQYYGKKPQVHERHRDWPCHIMVNPNDRGVHLPITKQTYDYLIWTFCTPHTN